MSPPPAALGVAAVALGLVGFVGGFATSSAFPMTSGGDRPIINPTAWEEGAPARPVSFSNTAAVQPKCPSWQINDTEMEAVLDEMLRRGWRAPNQGMAIALTDSAGVAAADPDAPMPSRRTWGAPAPSEDEPAAAREDTEAVEATEAPPGEPAAVVRPPA